MLLFPTKKTWFGCGFGDLVWGKPKGDGHMQTYSHRNSREKGEVGVSGHVASGAARGLG